MKSPTYHFTNNFTLPTPTNDFITDSSDTDDEYSTFEDNLSTYNTGQPSSSDENSTFEDDDPSFISASNHIFTIEYDEINAIEDTKSYGEESYANL